jgi:hypothetical protein
MATRGSRIAARLRRGLGLRRAVEPVVEPVRSPAAEPPEAVAPTPPAASPPDAAPARLAALRGLGERSSTGAAPPGEGAAEAELDTLRGELVRELDRIADGDHGSGSFRRIAS